MDYRLAKLYESMLNKTGTSVRARSLSDLYESIAEASSDTDSAEQTAPKATKAQKPGPSPLKGYDEIVAEVLGAGVAPKGTYQLGSFKSITDSEDLANFKKLFNVSPPTQKDPGGSKGSGKGEISLYWLLKKDHPDLHDNRDGDKPDLSVGGIGLEVKSYPGKAFALGKFKKQQENRKILSLVFGINALSNVKKGIGRIPATDVFNGRELEEAFEQMITLQAAFSELSADVLARLAKLPLINALQQQFDTVKSFLGLGDWSNIKAEDAAAKVLKSLLKEKLSTKPGFGGYIVNVTNSGQVSFYQADENKLNSMDSKNVIKSTSAVSGELAINNPEIFFK